MVSSKPVEVVSVYADRLFENYESNEVATDIGLKGKIVEVKGHVQSIDKDVFGGMYVGLETKNRFMPAQMHLLHHNKAK